MKTKTLICSKGHNKSITGADNNGHCSECRRQYIKTPKIREYYKEQSRKYRKTESYKRWLKTPQARQRKLRKFGLSVVDYDNLFRKQNGCCAICLNPQYTKRLAVDHSHKTGKVRGLLCSNCNRGIGYLKDSYTILMNASLYVIS